MTKSVLLALVYTATALAVRCASAKTSPTGLHLLKVGEDTPIQLGHGMILSWNKSTENFSVDIPGQDGKGCKIGDAGTAFPAWSIYRIGETPYLVAYFETVTSDLLLVDVKECKTERLKSSLGTSFSAKEYVVPAWCDESHYPNLVHKKEPQKCRAAETYTLKRNKHFELKKRRSLSATLRQVGIAFEGEALILNPGSPRAKRLVDSPNITP